MRQTEVFQPNRRVMNAFIQWIEQPYFNQQHARNWAQLYKCDPEAAMCEATFWAVLSDCGVTVTPNADLTGRSPSPDFLCFKNGVKFYVEVTCIQTETATRETALQSIPAGKSATSYYRPLNDAVFRQCVNKTPQCANLDAPCLVGVGTFHFQGSVLGVRKHFVESLLTGEPSIAMDFDEHAGRCVGDPYEITQFGSATFTRNSKIKGIEHSRRPISGLLLGGLGCDPVHVLGVLHPSPVREFDPDMLCRIPFCRQKIDLQAGIVSTEWIQTPDDWDGEPDEAEAATE